MESRLTLSWDSRIRRTTERTSPILLGGSRHSLDFRVGTHCRNSTRESCKNLSRVLALLISLPRRNKNNNSDRVFENLAWPTEVIGRNTVLPTKNFNTRVICDFDFNMSRCVAKIAFNYLAYVLGENTNVLLRTDFDGIRKYVRERTSPGYPVLSFSSKPKFDQDADRPPFVNRHMLGVGSDHATGSITCAISLFNAMSYRVLVCRKYEGLWFTLWSAHAFDFDTGEARPLPVNLLAEPVLI